MNSLKDVKKGTKIGLIVFLALSAALFLYQLIALIVDSNARTGAGHVIATLVIIAAIVLYVFVGYKKPHGNMLRYLFFFFGLYLAFQAALDFRKANLFVPSCVFLLAALIVTYISGRLNKIEKNKPLLVFAGILLLLGWIGNNFIYGNPQSALAIVRMIGTFGHMIYLAALGFAYVARYEEHKAAGLEDK